MRDGGEVSATIALVPSATPGTAHANAVADFENDSLVNYRLIFPDGATNFAFAALLTTVPHELPLEDRMALQLTYKVSGQGQELTITYVGTVEGDTIKGKVSLGELGEGTFTGKRG